MVYHLEVVAYNNRYGVLIDRDSYYTGVYSTLEKAVDEGLCFINKRFKDIYQQSDYCTNEEDTLTLEDMFKDDMIFYNFKITELDPMYADNFTAPKEEKDCKGLKPTHIIYYYDYDGKLKNKEIEHIDKSGKFGYINWECPNNGDVKK